MKWKIYSPAAALLLMSCATATQSFDEAGRPVLRVSCDGALVPMSKCYEKANQECPAGWLKISENTGQIASGNLSATPFMLAGRTDSTPIIEKTLVVRCK